MTHTHRGQRLTTTAVVMASLIVGGCGGDEPSAVCDDVDTLAASIADLGDVELEQGALASLQDKATQVQDDVSDLVATAEEEYAAEIDSVDQALSAVGTSLEAAVATPSGPSLAAVGADLQSLGTSMKALADAVQDSC